MRYNCVSAALYAATGATMMDISRATARYPPNDGFPGQRILDSSSSSGALVTPTGNGADSNRVDRIPRSGR